ncbi:efflux RND transporter periplasmic adaptor subunit [Vandammella animalimorsus]|nr:efflux RND transporter periplasmic adaptor subunit [Vandammella animalimorsus]
MKKPLLWFLVLTTLALLAWGGTRAWQREQARAQALQQEMQQRQALRVRLLPSEITTVQALALPQQVPASGTLRPAQRLSIKAQAGGRVQQLQLREGQAVRAGQRLFVIAAPDAAARVQQAQQQARAAQAQLSMAQRTADNDRALAEQGFLSPTARASSATQLQAARAQHQAALAAVEVARKGLGDTQAHSPIDGLVAARHVQPGEVVAPGQTVLEIVAPQAFEWQAEVAAADARHLAPGQRAQLWIEGGATPRQAELERIGPATQAGSRNVAVFLRLLPPGADGEAASQTPPDAAQGALAGDAALLRDGLFAHGHIRTGAQQVLAVPQTAIRTERPQPYVLALQGQRVQQRSVTLGPRALLDGQPWQAIEGVAAGTPILSGAAGLLADGTPVQIEASADVGADVEANSQAEAGAAASAAAPGPAAAPRRP